MRIGVAAARTTGMSENTLPQPDAAGGWRPNPGADGTENVPYEIGGRRPGA
jgi:hypothetical protein